MKSRIFTSISTVLALVLGSVFGTAQTNTFPISGNVGIGTTNSTYPLSVNGTVEAKEVIVQTGWSDYVFSPTLRLEPLSQVEQQIRQKGHLPGMPSAKEVAAHGISLGEMQAKLLAKVEELTLYTVHLQKENEALKARVSALETR
jgi:hypothetical protein